MEKYPKFVIEDNSLIMSNVQYHKHMVTDPTKVNGGGWFRWLRMEDKDILIFYGDSTDFGKAKIEDIKRCVEEDKVYTNTSKQNSIAKNHKIAYFTDTELIYLN